MARACAGPDHAPSIGRAWVCAAGDLSDGGRAGQTRPDAPRRDLGGPGRRLRAPAGAALLLARGLRPRRADLAPGRGVVDDGRGAELRASVAPPWVCAPAGRVPQRDLPIPRSVAAAACVGPAQGPPLPGVSAQATLGEASLEAPPPHGPLASNEEAPAAPMLVRIQAR